MSEASYDSNAALEWSLFQNGSVSLYHRPDVLRGDIERLIACGYVVYQFAAATWGGEPDFHDALGAALGLPDFACAGRNINAFNDRLARVRLPEKCALVFWSYEKLTVREPKFAQWVLDVFQKHSRWQLFCGKRLVVLLQSDDVSLRFDPIGACAVLWAPGEAPYVHKKRWSEGRTDH